VCNREPVLFEWEGGTFYREKGSFLVDEENALWSETR